MSNGSEFGKVAVLMGGPSSEREISFMSGKAVLAALQGKGVDAHAFDPAERSVFELKADGFKLAIDDFGSGFSSFHYLRRFPIDYLKIEGDFISNMLHSEKDHTFVTSIRSLAREMGITVVAEYVESAEVLGELERMEVHLAQGYYIGRPARDLLPVAWQPPELAPAHAAPALAVSTT